MQPFLRNSWYMAAWANEVDRVPLARRIIDIPVVLYRTGTGQTVALKDECPHRFAPLSKGRLTGDLIQCGYHGLKFNPEGVCVGGHFPGTGSSALRVDRFAVAERDRILW